LRVFTAQKEGLRRASPRITCRQPGFSGNGLIVLSFIAGALEINHQFLYHIPLPHQYSYLLL